MARWIQTITISALLVFLPLARGGVLEWTRASAITTVGCVFFITWTINAFSRINVFENFFPWFLVWGVLSVLIGLQLVAWSGFQIHPWEMPSMQYTRVSVFPLETVSWWATFTMYWMVAWMTSTLARRHVLIIAWVISGVMVFEVIYGLMAFIRQDPTIFGIWERHVRTQVAGSFINRSNFAGLIAVSLPVFLSVCFSHNSKDTRLPNITRYAIAGIVAAVVVLALFSSYSRLGVTATLCGVLAWVLIFRSTRESDAGASKTMFVLIGLSAIMLGVWFGLGALFQRFSGFAEGDLRTLVWMTTLDLPWSVWLVGSGAGSFVDAFRTVSPPELASHTWRQAHNDYLEFVVEFGVIGSLITLTALVYWGRKVRPRSLSTLQTGALAGIIAMVIHSIGDFNLQTPGVAIVFWVAVGILFNPSLAPRTNHGVG